MNKVKNNKKVEEIDVSKNRIYVVVDGKAIPIDPPPTGFGEQTAIWKDGKVLDVINTERIRIQ